MRKFKIMMMLAFFTLAAVPLLRADYDPGGPGYDPDEGVDTTWVLGFKQLTTEHSPPVNDFESLPLWDDGGNGDGDHNDPGPEPDDWVQCWGTNPWSMDGRWVIFTSNIPYIKRCPDKDIPYKDYHHAICRIHPDGTGFEQLTTNDKGESHGGFLGSGTNKIIFQRGSDIWLKDLTLWTEPSIIVDAFEGGYEAPAGEINLSAVHENEAGVRQSEEEVPGYGDDEGEDEIPGEQKPVSNRPGTKIAFHKQGRVWVMDADGSNAVNVSGKRVDIPADAMAGTKDANIIFTRHESNGAFLNYTASLRSSGIIWEDDIGSPLDLCDQIYDVNGQSVVGLENFVFPFAGTQYGQDPKGWDLYVSPNGFVSLNGDNDDIDNGCENGGPDKLLNGNSGRIAPFWTHLAREYKLGQQSSTDCPQYGVYINAFYIESGDLAACESTCAEGDDACTEQCVTNFEQPVPVYAPVEEKCNNDDCDCVDPICCDYNYFQYFIFQGEENNQEYAAAAAEPLPEDSVVTRVVVTWKQMKLIDNDKRISFQLQMKNNGDIIMAYDFLGDPDYEINNSKKVLIGIAPGNPGFVYDEETWRQNVESDPGSTDLSECVSCLSDDNGAIYEFFYKLHGVTKHSWSPDGRWVLFNGNPGCGLYPDIFQGFNTHDSGGKQRVFKVRADGYDLTLMSELGEAGDYCDNWATWSPKGDAIAYHRNDWETGIKSVRIISGLDLNPDEEGYAEDVELLAGSEDAEICGPTSWAPDSRSLVFKRSIHSREASDLEDGDPEIFMINIGSGEERQLTNGYYDARMWWSPVNSQILFRENDWSSNTRDAVEEVSEEKISDGKINGNGLDLLVLNLNNSPVADAGPDKTIYGPGMPVALDGSGSSDPENHLLTYEWTQVSTADIPSLDAVSQPEVDTLRVDCNSTATFELMVTDEMGLEAEFPDSVTLSIVCIEGDFDMDGDVDKGDLDILLAKIYQGQTEAACISKCDADPSVCAYGCEKLDVNGDGKFTKEDVLALIKINPLLARDERVRTLLYTPTVPTRPTRVLRTR